MAIYFHAGPLSLGAGDPFGFARRVVVCVGGVASTDGGVGAVEVLPTPLPLPVEVAHDVGARFLDAADVLSEIEAVSVLMFPTPVLPPLPVTVQL